MICDRQRYGRVVRAHPGQLAFDTAGQDPPWHIRCGAILTVSLILSLAIAVTAGAETGANARFLNGDEVTAGQKLPVALQLANTSAADIRQVRIKTNQLFEYRLDVLIPARQTGDVTFEPWYFDGALNLSAIEGLDAAGKLLVSYAPAELKPRLGAADSSGGEKKDLLGRLAARTHLRPDLIGYADQNKGQIPSTLFSSRSWQLADEWRFLIPAIVVTALLVGLALVGDLLSRRVKVAALVIVVLGGAGWTVVRAAVDSLAMFEKVEVVYHDGASGRTLTEQLAAVTALRSKMVTLEFNGGAQPRLLVATEADRVMYEGVILHRHTGEQWTVEKIPATPGLILAFGVEYWDEWPGAKGDLYWVQSGVPGVRLGCHEEVQFNKPWWCYVAGRAWPMGPVEDGYRPVGDSVSIDAAAFSPAALYDPYWQRAMRWVAKEYVRPGVGVLFGQPPYALFGMRLRDIYPRDMKYQQDGEPIMVWLFPVSAEP
jgi:hypothetical protein